MKTVQPRLLASFLIVLLTAGCGGNTPGSDARGGQPASASPAFTGQQVSDATSIS